jgi:predicted TIM-barrel fold metal-dependent hydrolase
VIDACAWTGHWGSFALPGAPADVVDSVADVGATRVLLSPLDGVWAHNAHAANRAVYAAAHSDNRVLAAPVIDPTVTTWEEELRRAVDATAHVVRWLPGYSGFGLSEADDWARAIGTAGRILWVQTRLEDPRRQHPRAMVVDTDAAEVVELALRHPYMTVVVGGATWRSVLDLAPAILSLRRCYADISQMDGMDSLLRLVDAGLAPRLLYGSHAPFFLPLAAVARVILDLDADTANLILHDNASSLLGLDA